MPIAFDGKVYEDQYALETGRPAEAQDASVPKGGTQVPSSENNAPASSAGAPRGIADKLLGISGDRYQLWPERALRTALGAASLPGDVYQGKVDPDSPEYTNRAAELASLMVLAPAPVASKAADGTLGSFMGVRSKTIDKSALDIAQAAERQGVSPDEIWNKTGMFRGADQRWRQEIDDSGSKWVNPSDIGIEITTLGKSLDHPELYAAYPHLKDTKLRVDPYYDRKGAYWDGSQIVLGKEAAKDKAIVMHEIQHAIQDFEAFAKGGMPGKNPKNYKLRYEDEINNLRKPFLELQTKEFNGEFLTAPEQAQLDKLKAIFKKYSEYSRKGDEEAYQNYLRLAGETEARNTQTRVDLDPIERTKYNPKFTQDVPYSKQILTDIPVATDPYMKP